MVLFDFSSFAIQILAPSMYFSILPSYHVNFSLLNAMMQISVNLFNISLAFASTSFIIEKLVYFRAASSEELVRCELDHFQMKSHKSGSFLLTREQKLFRFFLKFSSSTVSPWGTQSMCTIPLMLERAMISISTCSCLPFFS